jgi:hypothetical protein
VLELGVAHLDPYKMQEYKPLIVYYRMVRTSNRELVRTLSAEIVQRGVWRVSRATVLDHPGREDLKS